VQELLDVVRGRQGLSEPVEGEPEAATLGLELDDATP
jgi:hypothetical protein